MRRWFLGGLALALCACGPHLTRELRLERSYLSSADCAQGPFVLKVPALGTRWGEEIELEAKGQPIVGTVKIATGDQPLTTWGFGNGPSDNSRCKLAPASDAVSTVAGGWSQPSFAVPAPSVAMAAPVKEAPVELVETTEPDKVLVYNAQHDVPVTRLINMSMGIEHPGQVGVTPGSFWTITFWSKEPQDLAHVVFVLRQHELVPSVPEKEWIAYLEKKKADDEADQKKRQLEANAESEKWSQHWTDCQKKLDDSDCEDVRESVERRDKGEAERQHRSFCASHLSDASCDDYRRDVAYAQLVKRVDDCRPHPNDPSCADVRERLKSDSPRGPPPSPRAEEQPPKPSAHAEWVPGSWVWDGWEYQWTGGGWRVPDSDIRANLTVQAPAPPPEPRVELSAAPRPVLGAVWVPGAWHWSGAGWIWIAGGWRMPPQPGLRWRPPVWVVSSRGVQLDPGRWVR